MLRIYLLGRFEVHRDDVPITRWGGRQTRDLVKALAVVAPRPLTREQLAEILWEEPPFGAERDLKVLVSRARRALGDTAHEALVTTETGYALNGSCWVDTTDMERLMTQGGGWERGGRPALAEASYRAAVDLYRGPLLAEDLYADWVKPYRERWHRLFTDSALALGALLCRRGDRGAIELAERLHADDPYSDTAIQAVMTARTAFGDGSAALAAYARFREVLRDELGAAPGSATEALYSSILRGEQPSTWPRPGIRAEPSPSADGTLVGRERELCALEGALEAAAAGEPTLVILKGVPGIGKTRLLQALEARAAGRFHVLEATGREADRHLPFQLLAEALRGLDLGPDELRIAMGPYADALADLLPEVEMPIDRPRQSTISQIVRRRLLEGFLHLIRTLAEQRPVLVSLDDLHWADPSTVEALTFCLRRLQSARVLCTVAVRRGEPEARVEPLENLPISRTIDPAPLPADAVRQLAGNVPPEVSERVVAQSDGVPFYVVELVRSLAESENRSAIPSEIRRAILQRVGRAPATGQQLLQAAAVLGDGFTLEAAAALAGLPVRAAVDALEDLEERHLIADAGSLAGHRFVHDLIQRSVYEGMGAARRRVLHGQAADLAIGADPAVIGGHARRAGRPEQACRLFRDAGDAALSRLATVEAAELYEAALESAREAQLDQPTFLDLLDRLGRARSARGDHQGAAEAHRSALELASDEVAVARQKLRLGWIAYYQHEPERAAGLSRHAEACGEATVKGDALLLQAKIAHATGRVVQAATQVAEAARLVAPEATPEVRALEVTVANHLGRFEEAVLRFRGAVEPLRRDGQLRPLASLMLHGGIALAGKGEYVRALSVLEESAVFCRQAGAEHLHSRVPNTLGSIYRELGDHNRAVELHIESIELARRSAFTEALAHSLVGRAELALDAGDTGGAMRHLEEARPIVHDPRVFYSWRVRMRWRLAASRLALMEQQRDEALQAAAATLGEAKRAGSPKYRILALLRRGEALGPSEGGAADARAALRLARRLDAAPLVLQAALALASMARPDERERLLRFAMERAQELAAPLPDDLRRSFLQRIAVLT